VPDQEDSLTQLAPRRVIEALQRYLEIEAGLAWGVLYHPFRAIGANAEEEIVKGLPRP